ncbi:MAG: hypothetical protein WAK01_17255 [Methylocystis sp.]
MALGRDTSRSGGEIGARVGAGDAQEDSIEIDETTLFMTQLCEMTINARGGEKRAVGMFQPPS